MSKFLLLILLFFSSISANKVLYLDMQKVYELSTEWQDLELEKTRIIDTKQNSMDAYDFLLDNISKAVDEGCDYPFTEYFYITSQSEKAVNKYNADMAAWKTKETVFSNRLHHYCYDQAEKMGAVAVICSRSFIFVVELYDITLDTIKLLNLNYNDRLLFEQLKPRDS